MRTRHDRCTTYCTLDTIRLVRTHLATACLLLIGGGSTPYVDGVDVIVDAVDTVVAEPLPCRIVV